MSQPERFVYLLIIVGYLVAGSLFALRTPPWQAPDEPAHYNYIAQAADGMLLPVIQEGDWDNDYLEALKSARFAPDMLGKLDTVRYENHQPPLYYWLSTPVFLLTGGSLIALRFFALFIGLFTVLLSYRVALAIFPNEQKIALAAMAFVAFLPQHLAILASVNNDSLALALVALMLLQTIRYLKHETVPVWQLGLLIGIAIVTKTTVYFMGAVILLAILLRWYSTEKDRNFTSLFQTLIPFAIPILIFAGLWFGRNVATYGFPDILGLGAHDRVVIGQTRTVDYIADIGQDTYLQQAWQTSYNSFRGQFGWMAVPMDAVMYLLLDILILIALSGCLLYITRSRLRFQRLENPVKHHITMIITLMITLTVLMYVYYNTTFVQFQGRYLFAIMIPLGITLAMGITAWRRFLLDKYQWTAWLPVFAFLWVFLLDIYLIWRVIPGALSPV